MDRIFMAQPIAPDYGQQFLFPPALEDGVPADHPARFRREFVEQLDLPALGFALPRAAAGRPPYAPSLLLKIWLYGCFFRIRAPRRLAMACGEALPLRWLCGLRAPAHNSLWRFWRDHKKALRAVFKQSVRLALQTGGVGLALHALAGPKIQAAASTAAGWNKEPMETILAALAAARAETELKIVAANADLDPPALRLPAGLAQRQALREQIQTGARPTGGRRPVPPSPRRARSPPDETARPKPLRLSGPGRGRCPGRRQRGLRGHAPRKRRRSNSRP